MDKLHLCEIIGVSFLDASIGIVLKAIYVGFLDKVESISTYKSIRLGKIALRNLDLRVVTALAVSIFTVFTIFTRSAWMPSMTSITSITSRALRAHWARRARRALQSHRCCRSGYTVSALWRKILKSKILTCWCSTVRWRGTTICRS